MISSKLISNTLKIVIGMNLHKIIWSESFFKINCKEKKDKFRPNTLSFLIRYFLAERIAVPAALLLVQKSVIFAYMIVCHTGRHYDETICGTWFCEQKNCKINNRKQSILLFMVGTISAMNESCCTSKIELQIVTPFHFQKIPVVINNSMNFYAYFAASAYFRSVFYQTVGLKRSSGGQNGTRGRTENSKT